jgi:hypothetical protein
MGTSIAVRAGGRPRTNHPQTHVSAMSTSPTGLHLPGKSNGGTARAVNTSSWSTTNCAIRLTSYASVEQYDYRWALTARWMSQLSMNEKPASGKQRAAYIRMLEASSIHYTTSARIIQRQAGLGDIVLTNKRAPRAVSRSGDNGPSWLTRQQEGLQAAHGSLPDHAGVVEGQQYWVPN